jgi:hypothetical protein
VLAREIASRCRLYLRKGRQGRKGKTITANGRPRPAFSASMSCSGRNSAPSAVTAVVRKNSGQAEVAIP